MNAPTEADISRRAWQIAEVEAGIEEAESGEFATDTEMKAIIKKYANLIS